MAKKYKVTLPDGTQQVITADSPQEANQKARQAAQPPAPTESPPILPNIPGQPAPAPSSGLGLQDADDFMRILANSLTFGVADKVPAMFSDKGYSEALAEEEALTAAARERSGKLGQVADATGMLLPVARAGQWAKALSKPIGKGIGVLADLTLPHWTARAVGKVAGRPVASALAGGTIGALGAIDEDQNVPEKAGATGLASGAAGLISPSLAPLVGVLAEEYMRRANKPVKR